MPPRKSAKAKKKAVTAKKKPAKKPPVHEVIEVRGARQNNLKGIDLDIPIGKLNVVTGPSGSGKSSLAFQTLYAEGQRRYVETFSPYTRQFFDRMDKPQVEAINGIPPAIAIQQQNAVKTTRSTVGTITEINDYLKLLFPRLCIGYDPETGAVVEPDSPATILRKSEDHFGAGTAVLVLFGIKVPPDADVTEFFEFLQTQGYLRVWVFGKPYRVDAPEKYDRKTLPGVVEVIQDRVAPGKKSRFQEAVERALDLGKGKIAIVEPDSGDRREFSRGWHSPDSGVELRPPTPGLFNFNHPLGACPECRGFGKVIGIDIDKAMPDKSLSIMEGLVKAFLGDTYSECQDDLERCARQRGLSIGLPYDEMDPEDQKWIVEGDESMTDPEEAWTQGLWYGVRGFFDWQETRAYKMHVRIFLSRYRSYTTCRKCGGGRLQPEALNFKVSGKTLPELWTLSIDDLLEFMEALDAREGDRTGVMLLDEIRNRLRFLQEVGLGYLNLDRPTKTLSGGETERVNLTTCLGASLTSTLFVLDEPTVGLHPRDVGKLIGVMERLRDLGNTLVVVEHEEAVIRAADHLIDIGPGRGELGGEMVYEGSGSKLKRPPEKSRSLTLDYLSGKKEIPVPKARRKPTGWINIERATQHNLKKIDAGIPLGVFCCVTGVSGSGKSTLVHSVLFENLTREFGNSSENEPGTCKSITGGSKVGEVVMVDQTQLARTPRSTPAVYTGVFEDIRKLFTETEDGKARGVTPGYFSFNSGAGRCERCMGNGYEKVEMQFLSDLYVTCPECEGTRYTKEAMEIRLSGQSIHDVLKMTVREAIEFFFAIGGKKATKIVEGLKLLAEVGLGYLRLGQPLNTLSGGESQRLKLVGHLLSKPKRTSPSAKPALLIFDEPTTGLHFDDVAMLLKVFDRLVEAGDSVLVIEHNLDVIKSADHLIDIGPEAGVHGGEIVATGTPENVAKSRVSRTGIYLRRIFKNGKGSHSDALQFAAETPQIVEAWGNGSRSKNSIQLFGARENNLKNINVSIPRDQFVVVTGLSGSGKSTISFDILFSEGQRRFLDSMSTFARQFVEQMEKPDIDHIVGLPPTVAIEQRISRGGGKSTVATVTEIWHFLRLLFSKVGTQYSPDTGLAVQKQSITAIVTRLREEAKKAKRSVRILAPLIKARKGFHTEVADWAARQGYDTLLVDGQFKSVDGFQKLERFKEHTIDVVIGDVDAKTKPEDLREMLETALKIGKNTARVLDGSRKMQVVSTEMSDPETGRSFEELDPRLFSYNSPHGWCPRCRGYGSVEKKKVSSDERDAESQLDAELREERRRSRVRGKIETEICPECKGARLNEVARFVRVNGKSIDEIAAHSVIDAKAVIDSLSFEKQDKLIVRDILPEISQRLKFLTEVGLGYLQLDRSATTLSGGESQRIRLAAQLGSNLRGVLYVLDEPTIGLHPRDNHDLLETLTALRKKGNSLVVVEHDEETMAVADHLIDLGPGAGQLGGEVVFNGSLKTAKKPTAAQKKNSPTLQALESPIQHPMRGERRKLPGKTTKGAWIKVSGAKANNLKNLSVQIPIGRLTVITGISGSGKSSFMRGVLKPAVETKVKKNFKLTGSKQWKTISGTERLETVYEVDQSPIGKTSRSTPATYVKVFDEIRKLFAQLPEARARGYTASRFSFNTEGGRCEPCKGNGQIKLEMNFLPTSYIRCEECNGRRFNDPTLEVEYNGKSIGDVMELSISQAAEFFSGHPKISRTLSLMNDTGLGYLKLGQPSPTVSGGEAQRIKLVSELTRGIGRAQNAKLRQNRTPKSNLYLIEEPSIGLHMLDVKRLLEVLHRLVDDGHTVVVIEHNIDIAAEADYIIDVGPEAGEQGGKIVAAGTPEEVSKSTGSQTAPFLKASLK